MSTQYLIVLPIEAMPRGTHYLSGQSLPLHCTVMPWFRLNFRLSFEDLEQLLARLVALPRNSFIELVSQKSEYFGLERDIPVHVLKPNDQLNLLHTRLFKFLAVTDCVLPDLKWIGAGYRPHVTDTQARQFLPETRHQPRTLTLVERDQNGNKFIQSEFILGGILS
jgi:hypothetical protein